MERERDGRLEKARKQLLPWASRGEQTPTTFLRFNSHRVVSWCCFRPLDLLVCSGNERKQIRKCCVVFGLEFLLQSWSMCIILNVLFPLHDEQVSSYPGAHVGCQCFRQWFRLLHHKRGSLVNFKFIVFGP